MFYDDHENPGCDCGVWGVKEYSESSDGREEGDEERLREQLREELTEST